MKPMNAESGECAGVLYEKPDYIPAIAEERNLTKAALPNRVAVIPL